MKRRAILGAALGLVAMGAAHAADAPKGGIAWYGRWEEARKEARRLNRPILLVSAAPHCTNVSGIW